MDIHNINSLVFIGFDEFNDVRVIGNTRKKVEEYVDEDGDYPVTKIMKIVTLIDGTVEAKIL